MILLIGPHDDPHVKLVENAVQKLGFDALTLPLTGTGSSAFDWSADSKATGLTLQLNGKPRQISAVFVRHPGSGIDAPSRNQQHYTATWRNCVVSLVMAYPDVRYLNRASVDRPLHKLLVLESASRLGWAIPRTRVTNDLKSLRGLADDNFIVKPVLGGLAAVALPDALNRFPREVQVTAVPAIVQERLRGPEYRVYCIGNTIVPLMIKCNPSLVDYREAQTKNEVLVETEVSLPKKTLTKVRQLGAHFGLDFFAVDLKTDKEKGVVHFLDLNEEPYFDEVDNVVDGKISKAIAGWLTQPHRGAKTT
ncbi:MAG: hypothetical protein IPK82_39685 [Polyangiaceae bacterium]|nr:hypothetical protein [Polyangiaceae bacterium]